MLSPPKVLATSLAMSSTIFALCIPHGKPRFLCFFCPCHGRLPAVGSCSALLLPQGPRFEFGSCAPAPASRGQAHAPLATLPVSFPVAVRLAVCPLRPVAGAASSGPHWLGRDGAQQVVPLTEKLGLAGETEAAFPERHAGGILGWP